MKGFARFPGRKEHQRVRELLSAYLDGQLSPDELALAKRHLACCEDCASYLRSLEKTVALVKGLPVVRAPRSFALSPAPSPPKGKPFRWDYALLRAATALAASLLVLVVSADLALHLLGQAVPSAPVGRQAVPPTELQALPQLIPTAPSEGTTPEMQKGAVTTEAPPPAEEKAPEPQVMELPPSEEVEAKAAPEAEAPTAVGLCQAVSPTTSPETEALEKPLAGVPSPGVPPQEGAEALARETESIAPSSLDFGEPVSPTQQLTEARVYQAVRETPPPQAKESPPPAEPAAPAPEPWDFLRWAEIGLLGILSILLAATLVARGKRQPGI